MAEFDMSHNKNNIVEYDFWLTSSSSRALDFLEDFTKFDESLKDKVKFTPHYVFWECTDCDKTHVRKDCFGGGRYCAVEPSNDMMKGREIVLEDLR